MYRDDKLNEVLEKFPHMYNIDIGSNNEFLISSVLEEIKNLNQAVYELASMLDVSKANGIWLDRLGNIFGVYRESGENDDIYRINILQYWLMVSKNATSEVLMKFLFYIIDEEDLYVYKKQNGLIHIIINKNKEKEYKHLIEKVLLNIKADGVNFNFEFKHRIFREHFVCGATICGCDMFRIENEEIFVDKLLEIKHNETNLTESGYDSGMEGIDGVY